MNVIFCKLKILKKYKSQHDKSFQGFFCKLFRNICVTLCFQFEFFNKVSRILRDEPEQLTYAESNFIAGLQFHIAFQSRYYEPTKVTLSQKKVYKKAIFHLEIYGITQTLNLYAILSSEFIDGLTE